jgi:hypothetical protein
MKLFQLTLLIVCLFVFTAPAQATPTLIFDGNGVWIGAKNVFIPLLGQTYDLSLRSGTCAQVFGVCDQAHFTFNDEQSATYAVQAFARLADTLVDPDNPRDPFFPGCGTGCLAVLPYDVAPFDIPGLGQFFPGVIARPAEVSAAHGVSLDGYVNFAVSPNTIAPYIVFTPTAVPESSTLLTLILGLSGAALRFRRHLFDR